MQEAEADDRKRGQEFSSNAFDNFSDRLVEWLSPREISLPACIIHIALYIAARTYDIFWHFQLDSKRLPTRFLLTKGQPLMDSTLAFPSVMQVPLH